LGAEQAGAVGRLLLVAREEPLREIALVAGRGHRRPDQGYHMLEADDRGHAVVAELDHRRLAARVPLAGVVADLGLALDARAARGQLVLEGLDVRGIAVW